ncbi:hypothetical protein ACNF49_36890 [Actinomadura sp. ATCC 39365]
MAATAAPSSAPRPRTAVQASTTSSTPSMSTCALFTASTGTAGHHAQYAARRAPAARHRIASTATAATKPPSWSALCRTPSGDNQWTSRK